MDKNGHAATGTRQGMRAILMDADGEDREIAPLDDLKNIPDDQIYWLIIETDLVGTKIDLLDGISIPNSLSGGVIVEHEHFRFSVPAAPNDAGLSHDVMTFVVGKNWLVTASSGKLPLTENYLENDTGQTLKGSITAAALCVSLMMQQFSQYHEQLAAVDVKIDQIDEQVLRARRSHDPLDMLAVLRRRTARLRTEVANHRAVIAALDRPDFGPEVCDEDRHHLSHLAATYQQLVDRLDRTREAVLASFDLYATRVAQDTNRLLERLTIYTIGVGMIAALAGIFGMNFQIGFFERGEVAFWTIVSVMGAIATITAGLAVARRSPH
jgi:magnesium transporter